MSFWAELKRRNVYKVGVAYLIVAWLLAQVIDVVLPTFEAPEWVGQTTILLLILGFPLVLIIAWAFEITPEGIKRTSSVPAVESITPVTGQKLNYVVIGLMAVAIAFLVVDNYVLDDAQSVGPAGAARLENSIAILPFDNLSPDSDNAFYAAGIHEEVLNQLTKLRNLSVISRTSMMRYADTQLSIPEIARELNVETVMEGSVRYADNRIRVTLQLIDAATDQHLWSETYDHEFENIFAIESDIAMNVANALEAEFSETEQQAIEQPPTSSPAAYALYLQALDLGPTLGSRDSAALLDRAIAIDPGFARAYALKALDNSLNFYNTTGGAGVAPAGRADLERQIREDAALALELDPSETRARAALRLINIPTWHWSAYRPELEAGDTNFSPVELWPIAWIGEPDEAVRIGERIAALDPQGERAQLAVAYAYAGDRVRSIGALEEVLEQTPANPLARLWLAFNHIALGNADAALADLQLVERMLGADVPVAFLPELAYGYARIGRREDAERLFAELQGRGNEADFGAGTWAMGYFAIGDEARAIEWLEAVAEKARSHEVDQGFIAVMNLKMNFLADPVLEKPEFVRVLAEITGD